MSEIDRVILMGKPHQEGHDEPADITIRYRHAFVTKNDITKPADITIGYIGRHACLPRNMP